MAEQVEVSKIYDKNELFVGSDWEKFIFLAFHEALKKVWNKS